MEFGLHLPNAGPFAGGPDILRVAREAEAMGFHSVWLFDHLFTPTHLESKYPYTADGSYLLTADMPFFDPVAVMAAVIGATEHIKVGTRVLIATYRHPVVLAKELATMDALGGGDRVILGVGAGWMAEEFDAVDVPTEGRGARLDEHMELMRRAWQQGTSSFDGRFYSHVEAGFRPQPGGAGNSIPIVIGGHTDIALRRAARYGDGWAVAASGEALQMHRGEAVAERVRTLGRFCEEEGRSLDDLLLVSQAVLGEDADALRQQVELGVDIVDLMSFGPTDQVLAAAERFMTEVAPTLS